MVVGRGRIASSFIDSFKEDKHVLIFASGVSNSQEKNPLEFNREVELVKKTIRENYDKKIIYFSSIFCESSDTFYYRHKRNIESIIQKESQSYVMIRLSQVISNSGNTNNLVNRFKKDILEGNEVNIYADAIRSIIDLDDLVKITKILIGIEKNSIIKLSKIQEISAIDLYKKMCRILSKPENFTVVKNNQIEILVSNSEIVDKIIQDLSIDRIDYTELALKKYII